ncbi:MAG: 16S rRNA (guanine(966)-N(2))-methyltransferase RsmD, partial [Synechococcaceae cyanobacterium]|nr:16S rRNA (guanine(966)-N(2))-methyltransferase RsmD [Synechococcaceae cyanobacterium]
MGLRLSGGRRLQSPPGERARPTAARVRQAVLNLMAADLPGSRWLDLCCGSGAMACEALQRGASAVVAVDCDRRIAATARANLEAVGRQLNPAPQLEVHCCEVLRWLERGRPSQCGGGFDLIYVDPPYAEGLYGPIAAAVARGGWLRQGGTLIWECASQAIPAVDPAWICERQRRYGLSTLMLLRAAGG